MQLFKELITFNQAMSFSIVIEIVVIFRSYCKFLISIEDNCTIFGYNSLLPLISYNFNSGPLKYPVNGTWAVLLQPKPQMLYITKVRNSISIRKRFSQRNTEKSPSVFVLFFHPLSWDIIQWNRYTKI